MTDKQPTKEHQITRTEELTNQFETYFSQGSSDAGAIKVVEMMREYGKKTTIQATKNDVANHMKDFVRMMKLISSLRDQYYQQEIANKKAAKKKSGDATVKGDVYLHLKGEHAELKQFFGDHVSDNMVKVDLTLLKRLESALYHEMKDQYPNRVWDILTLSNDARKAPRGNNNPSLLKDPALDFFAEADLGLTLDGKKLSDVLKPIFVDEKAATFGIISNSALTRLMSIYNRHHSLGVAEEGYGSIFIPDKLMKKHFKSQLDTIQKKADASIKKEGYDKTISKVGMDYKKIDSVKKLVELTDKLLAANKDLTKSQAKLISFAATVVSGLGIRFSDLRILISEIIMPLRDLTPEDKQKTENEKTRAAVSAISLEIDKFFDHLSEQAKH